MASGKDRQSEVLEEGDIFFLYRPTVEEDEPSGLGDVQRFYVVLRPQGSGSQGGKLRLLVMGRKRLPDVERHERAWGFVETVASAAGTIEKELRETDYETKTRGKRRLPAARPAGEGVYAVTLEDGQMHLSYSLELPEQPREVQQAFKIAPEASYALSIKNPEVGQPGSGRQAKADYPQTLQEEFRGRRFAREDVRLLDYEGAEFILVGARRDPEEAYGVALETEKEDEAHADIINRLRLVKSRHPIAPLFEGRWA
jgi:hypothetical protein